MANQAQKGAYSIADMAIFLSTDKAAYVNGAIIPVDGGSGCGERRDGIHTARQVEEAPEERPQDPA